MIILWTKFNRFAIHFSDDLSTFFHTSLILTWQKVKWGHKSIELRERHLPSQGRLNSDSLEGTLVHFHMMTDATCDRRTTVF